MADESVASSVNLSSIKLDTSCGPVGLRLCDFRDECLVRLLERLQQIAER